MAYTYEFPRPMVTVDAVIFRRCSGRLEVLLIRRGKGPFNGMFALPGGFLEIDEDLLEGAQRELLEETGLKNVSLEQLGAFGRPGRDPRGRTVSVVFFGMLRSGRSEVLGGDDASEALWMTVRKCPKLAFDHNEIVEAAVKRLKKSGQRK